MIYEHLSIEKKWQDFWYSNKSFAAKNFSKKPKYYSLVEFPYPSGAGMHVGHIRAYTSLEIISRKRRMEGYNVLFPIGFDAFGLPTENYALKTGIHPRVVTDTNIITFTNQLKKSGFSFDFDRVIDTTDEEYYKWTQFIFLKLYEKKLAFKNTTYVNFCPDCKVVLANEESQGGKCDRCGSGVVQLEKDVWFLKITEYAQKLLDGLDDVDFLPRIKLEQKNWIGKSTGAEVNFKVKETTDELVVYTTRPDTLFGATFMVIAPEHSILKKNKDIINNYNDVLEYKEYAKSKTEFERVELAKEKTGVLLDGLSAINPVNNKQIPIFVADYVMMSYGTGAIMAVPAHDTRDYEFAKKYNLEIIEVISGGDLDKEAFTDIVTGKMVNSDFLNDLTVSEAKETIMDFLSDNKIGERTTNFKMKDWAFNRQRYWGEPIPIIYCPDCGEVPVPYEDLPVKLPKVDNFAPSDTGESPLSTIEDYVNTICPKCGKPAKRETDTMPQWAGSSWYYLRYMDPKNTEALADSDVLKYWGQVDWYNGGMEHVTRHLIYSRFWHRFLYDNGIVPNKEPYAKRSAQGLILGPDGEKMSKSKGNVINPLDIIEEYGADTLRLYIMFIGDYEQPTPWNDNGVKGCRRFIEKVWRLNDKVIKGDKYTKSVEPLIHKTIKAVSQDLEDVKFNTAIAKLMTLTNQLLKLDQITSKDFITLITLLNPFAPHITEELNSIYSDKSLVYSPWPTYDDDKLIDSIIEIVLSVNGKVRSKISIEADMDRKDVEKLALSDVKVQQFTLGKDIKKIIYVPKKLVNIVV